METRSKLQIFSILWLVFASFVSASAASIDLFCTVSKCGFSALDCRKDKNCGNMLNCLTLCFNDEKCRIKCSLNHGHDNHPAFMFFSCLRDSNCMKPQPGAQKCILPSNTLRLFDIGALDGTWWVIHGFSPVYDCWDCQKMAFKRLNDGLFDYSYDLLTDKDTIRKIPCTVERSVQDDDGSELLQGRLDTKYVVQRVFEGKDDWHVLDMIDGYMLIYYCGKSQVSAEYTGAILIARDPHAIVPSFVLDRFDEKLVQSGTGIRLKQFCTNDNSKCPQLIFMH